MPHLLPLSILYFLCTSLVTSAPTPKSLWGSFPDAIVDGIMVENLKRKGVAMDFDYVIVGGGAAGLTAANRLTENPDIRVAVVEAGGFQDNSPITFQLGNLAVSTFVDPTSPAFIPEIDYIDITEPVKANGYKQHYPQGRMLGGSHARGFAAYNRASKGAYQKWADEVGDTAYTWDKFNPYMKKSVSFTPPNIELRGQNTSDIMFDATAFNAKSNSAPLQVSYAHFASPLSTWMKLGWQSLGVKPAKSFSTGTLSGIQYASLNINSADQHRSTAGASMLAACRNRTNLVVFTHTQAAQIAFDSNKTATGVIARDLANNTFTLSAKNEVVSAAGVFRTPQLLMVSGIGPSAVLNQFDIPIIVDSPGVGQNLQDQSFVGIFNQVNFNTTSQIFNQDFAESANKLFGQGKGILTDALDIQVFENVPPQFASTLSANTTAALAELPSDWPVFQYLPVNSDLLIFRNIANKPPGPTQNSPNYGSLACSLSAPLSKGSVSIRSASNIDKPVVDIGYLNDERDIELLMVAFKRGREAWASAPMASQVIGKEYWPGLDFVPDGDDAAIRKHVIENVMPIWEATSSCKMGKAGDKMAVVDSKGKVFGANNLRIVDSSTIPFSLPGHPAASVFGLAEMMAELMAKNFKNTKV